MGSTPTFGTINQHLLLLSSGYFYRFGVILLVGLFLYLNLKPKTNQFVIKSVQNKDIFQVVSASGEVKAKNQVDLKFQTSGLLTWAGVKEGDYIQKWQTIASLDKRTLERNIIKALRDYSKERWDFEQDKQVTYKDQIINDTIRRILEKNQFDLDKAVADVEIADIAMKLATITTPISGIATRVDAPIAGVNVTPATTFTIADPQSVYFSANIDEVDIGKIFKGQKVKIVLDAYPNENFSGEVTNIKFASIQTNSGGIAFPAEVSLPVLPIKESAKFKIGMNGDIEIVTQEKLQTLAVPAQAIFTSGDKNFIWKVINKKAHKQEIKAALL